MNPISVGTAGWSIPKQLLAHFDSTGTHLEKYASEFNGAEINSSFYRDHKPETYEKFDVGSFRNTDNDFVNQCRCKSNFIFLICGFAAAARWPISSFVKSSTYIINPTGDAPKVFGDLFPIAGNSSANINVEFMIEILRFLLIKQFRGHLVLHFHKLFSTCLLDQLKK